MPEPSRPPRTRSQGDPISPALDYIPLHNPVLMLVPDRQRSILGSGLDSQDQILTLVFRQTSLVPLRCKYVCMYICLYVQKSLVPLRKPTVLENRWFGKPLVPLRSAADYGGHSCCQLFDCFFRNRFGMFYSIV